MILKSILAGAAAVAVLGNVSAAVFVTSTSGAPTAGDSTHPGTLALLWFAPSDGGTFTVGSLGAYAPDNGSDTLTVKFWQEGVSSPLASVAIDTSTGTPSATGFLYSSAFAPFTTVSGGHYALTVENYSSNKVGDALGGDPSISGFNSNFTSATRVTSLTWNGTTNPWLSYSTDDATRFLFADFTATYNPVPEPEVYASIAGLALVGFGLYRRQVRK